MSSVTFSTSVGGDGSTVTDDNNATTGLREGGWKTRFVPCFTQQVAVANYIVTKAGEASTSASAASASASAAAASYDLFDDRYLGSKTSDPPVDNDGNALITGAIYWNSSSSVMKVWSGSAWVSYNPAISYLALSGGVMTGAITFNAGQTISGYLPTAGGTMTGDITFNAGQTVANLASGSAGTIPYQSASGTTQMLAVGTAGQVLQTNGASAPTWVTPSSGAMTLLSTVTASNSATVDIENTFDSTYDAYLIVASGVTVATNNSVLSARMKLGGAYDTGTNYKYLVETSDNSSVLYNANCSNVDFPGGATFINICRTIGNAASASFDFTMYIFNPSSTALKKQIYWSGVYITGAATPLTTTANGIGSNTATTALTGIRILSTSNVGDIVAGSFRLYGIKN